MNKNINKYDFQKNFVNEQYIILKSHKHNNGCVTQDALYKRYHSLSDFTYNCSMWTRYNIDSTTKKYIE